MKKDELEDRIVSLMENSNEGLVKEWQQMHLTQAMLCHLQILKQDILDEWIRNESPPQNLEQSSLQDNHRRGQIQALTAIEDYMLENLLEYVPDSSEPGIEDAEETLSRAFGTTEM